MEFPVPFGLLAQGTGFEDWANILVVAVMAVLWLLGALAKTISKKASLPKEPNRADAPKGQRRSGETWQERLARKAEEMQRRIEEEAGLREPSQPSRPARPTPRRSPQAPGGKIVVRSDSKGGSVMVYEPPPQPQPATNREHQAARQREAQQAVAAAGQYAAKQMPSVEKPIGISAPKLEPVIEDLSHVMAESPKPPDPSESPRKPARESAGFEVAAVIDYSDPDALKKAVLHYEILGKPLGLRDTPDQTSLF